MGVEKGLRCFDVRQGIRGTVEEGGGRGELGEEGEGSSWRGATTIGRGGSEVDGEVDGGEGGKMGSLILAVGGANGKVV